MCLYKFNFHGRNLCSVVQTRRPAFRQREITSEIMFWWATNLINRRSGHYSIPGTECQPNCGAGMWGIPVWRCSSKTWPAHITGSTTTPGLFQRVFEQNASINPLAEHVKMGSPRSPDVTEMLGGGHWIAARLMYQGALVGISVKGVAPPLE